MLKNICGLATFSMIAFGSATAAHAETISNCEKVDYRNKGARDSGKPLADRVNLIPLAFLDKAQRKCEVYFQPRMANRLVAPVAHFSMNGQILKATVTRNTVTYTFAVDDYDLAKTALAARADTKVRHLQTCSRIRAAHYTCFIRPNVDEIVFASVASRDGKPEYQFQIKSEELVVKPKAGSSVTLGNAEGDWQRIFKVDRMLAQAGVPNRSLHWHGREARAIMDAMSDGENLTLRYTGEDGSLQSLDISARNFGLAFGLLRPTLAELAALD